ncbi:glycoside hydrolase family 3 N-terminal domain-containing protein, partial [Acinetobacter baumannii]
LIVSDDLDAPAILRGKSIDEIAVQALNSGVDLLLLSSENDLDQIAQYISLSVASGNLDRERLSNAANKVRNLSFKKNLNNN